MPTRPAAPSPPATPACLRKAFSSSSRRLSSSSARRASSSAVLRAPSESIRRRASLGTQPWAKRSKVVPNEGEACSSRTADSQAALGPRASWPPARASMSMRRTHGKLRQRFLRTVLPRAASFREEALCSRRTSLPVRFFTTAFEHVPGTICSLLLSLDMAPSLMDSISLVSCDLGIGSFRASNCASTQSPTSSSTFLASWLSFSRF
mmetsp:Transcript_31163/g.68299  ORF Transcript_31163/g.68299 Transcript_31163/m.68299 type:complete len:207 (+) Transcript_31163:186-806(+)